MPRSRAAHCLTLEKRSDFQALSSHPVPIKPAMKPFPVALGHECLQCSLPLTFDTTCGSPRLSLFLRYWTESSSCLPPTTPGTWEHLRTRVLKESTQPHRRVFPFASRKGWRENRTPPCVSVSTGMCVRACVEEMKVPGILVQRSCSENITSHEPS